MVKIGLIGSESMHARAFAEACNKPLEDGSYPFPGVSVVALWGADDTREHAEAVQRQGGILECVDSMKELMRRCDAFMVLPRRGREHIRYAEPLLRRGFPVFIDKPVCSSYDDIFRLRELAGGSGAVLCGGSGLKHNRQVRQLKEKVEKGAFGRVRGGTVNHSADRNSPYEGIFFYLPHGVEIMLEVFGYQPESVTTTVLSADNFTVCVKYREYLVNLAINGCSPSYLVINGEKSAVVQIDDSDIFSETMAYFVRRIRSGVSDDVERLVKSSLVILAVKRSMEEGSEIKIGEGLKDFSNPFSCSVSI